jgi:beta-phosphoglucomutase-like phosphatase (HAD superfamily)
LIVDYLLGEKRKKYFNAILAGDIVKRKKPDPEIYYLCRNILNIDPKKSVVIEDSEIGFHAARAAGFNCLITTNDYTKNENFEGALLVVEELGDEPDIKVTIKDIETIINR